MTAPRRAALTGTGAALAVSLPVALVAQILAATRDDEVPAPVVIGLAAVVLAGALLGGWTVRRLQGGQVPAALAGALALGVVAALGVLRRIVAGEDHGAPTIVGAVALGAVAGVVGWALGPRSAARTRP
ncbi:MAG: hypothetical protein ACO1PW_11045 [Actinomycetota bacterium]